MAHFAELDENNKVLRVCVVDDAYVSSDMHVDGEIWCQNFWGGKWKQTSYTRKFRKQYATVDGTYDEVRDAFIDPRPTGIYNEVFNSWIYNEVTGDWDPPTPYPDDGQLYTWNEGTTSWDIYVE